MVIALTLDLSINVSFNPTRSIIADVTPEGNPRTKGYTWMQTISGSFGVLAYAIGAIWGNYFLIYFGVGLVLFFTIIPSLFIEEPKALVKVEDESEEDSASKTDLIAFLKISFANAFSWIGVQTMFVFIIAFITQKMNPTPDGATAEMIKAIDLKTGQIISVSFLILNAVGALLPAFVLEAIAERIGRVKTQMLSVAIMSEVVDKSKMGFYMGMFNLSIVIPQLLVSLAVGLIVQSSVDKNIVFLISGVTLAISALFWMLVKDKKTESD